MHHPKPADQVTFKWTPPLLFSDLGQRSNMLWIKPHIGLIKIKFYFSVVHFDDKYITFEVASCFVVPDPIFHIALFGAISCWNHINDYHTVLNPCNFTCWLLTPLHYTDVLSWMAIFHLVVNEIDFSVQFERRTLLKPHDIIFHASFNWNYKCNYEWLEHVMVMVTWSWNADTGRKTISGLNHIM